MIRTSPRISPSMTRKPRASGDDPPRPDPLERATNVNPARAGMIRADSSLGTSGRGKPRASGDDPTASTGEDETHK